MILRSLSGNGLARESAAVARWELLWLTNGSPPAAPASPPEGVQAFIVLDWKDDRPVGIEILDASRRLHPDRLEEAEILS